MENDGSVVVDGARELADPSFYRLGDGADIAKVQERLGRANITTTRPYDQRRSRPEDSPTLRMSYKKMRCTRTVVC